MQRAYFNQWSYDHGDSTPDEFDTSMLSYMRRQSSFVCSKRPMPAMPSNATILDVSKSSKFGCLRKGCNRYLCLCSMSTALLISLLIICAVLLAWGLTTNGFQAYSLREIPKVNENKQCSESTDCHALAFQMEERLNVSIDHCQDLFSYACRRDSFDFSPNQLSVDLMEQIDENIKDLVSTGVALGDSKSEISVNSFYAACMDAVHLLGKNMETIHKMVNFLGGCPALRSNWTQRKGVTWEIIEGQIYRLYGKSCLIRVDVKSDPWNVTRNVISLSTPSSYRFTRLYKYANREHPDTYHNSYSTLFEVIVDLFGTWSEDTKHQLHDITSFESKLNNHTESDFLDASAPFTNLMSLKDLQAEFPNIKWLDLMENIFRNVWPINRDVKNFYIEDSFGYLRVLNHMIMNVDPGTLANIQLFTVLEDYLHYVTKDSEANQWKNCVSDVKKFFPWTTSLMYIKSYFIRATRDEVLLLASNVQRAMERKITQLGLHTETMMLEALTRLSQMTFKVGFPDLLIHEDQKRPLDFDESSSANSESYLTSILQLAEARVNTTLEQINDIHYDDDWPNDLYPFFIDVVYDFDTNCLVIPAGIIRTPYFSLEYPRYVQYARLGFLIAKAMWSSVSKAGRFLNRKDGLRPSLTNKTLVNYKSLSACLKRKQEMLHKVRIPSDNFIDESIYSSRKFIDDNFALKIAYDAYNIWKKDNAVKVDEPLSGFFNASDAELFGLSFVSMFCCTRTSIENMPLMDDIQMGYTESGIGILVRNSGMLDQKAWNCSFQSDKERCDF